jgi:hypothetical protein
MPVKEVEVAATCSECRTTDRMMVDATTLGRFMLREALVQRLFPSLSARERELVMGHRNGFYLCDRCWSKFMGDGEEE